MRPQRPQRARPVNRARPPRPDLREARFFMWAFSSSVLWFSSKHSQVM
ncbi:MAG: hypothetical protein OXC28_17640 [Defluviicoccus sp.]|nr:hypothetical protein [Defluviicoccus sp.]